MRAKLVLLVCVLFLCVPMAVWANEFAWNESGAKRGGAGRGKAREICRGRRPGVSELEEMLAWQLQAAGIAFTRQYRAIPGRRWRWDFAWPEWRLLIEVQGGIWIPSGHTTGQGIARDIEKHNAVTLAGWRVLYVTREMIADGTALNMIEEAMEVLRAES